MAKFIAINSEFGCGTRNIHGPRGSLTSSMGPEYGRIRIPPVGKTLFGEGGGGGGKSTGGMQRGIITDAEAARSRSVKQSASRGPRVVSRNVGERLRA